MWIKKLKQKKGQFLLIAIILVITSIIFTVSINFGSGVDKYTTEFYSRENITDMVVQTYDKNTVKEIVKFIENDSENLKGYKEAEALNFDMSVYHKGENTDMGMVNLIPFSKDSNMPWTLTFREGEDTKYPKEGQIFVNSLLAELNGFKVGDKLGIKDGDKIKEFEISALINDALIPSTTLGIFNFYINDKDFNNFENRIESTFLGYNTALSSGDAVKAFGENVKDGVLILDKSSIIMTANTVSLIASSICTCISLLLIIAAILIIRFIIRQSILKEYKSIGIYKTLGLTSREIKGIYIKCFGIVSISSIILGAILSVFFTGYLIEISVKYIGNYENVDLNIGTMILSIVILSLIVVLSVFISLRRVGKIKPVEAFRVGVSSSKSKFKKSLIKDAVSPLATAINDILKYKKQNIMIFFILTIAIYMVSFFFSVNYSIGNMGENSSKVFGVVTGDAVLEVSNNEEIYNKILKDLKSDSKVNEIKESAIDAGKNIYIDMKKYNINNAQLITIINSSYEEENGFKVDITEGRNPINEGEIAVSSEILKDSGLEIGDYIEVDICGTKKELLITGVYSSMLGNGYSTRILLDSIDEGLRKNITGKSLVLSLDEDFDSFKNRYEEKYEECSIDKTLSMLELVNESIEVVIEPLTVVIAIGSAIFCMINIINLLVMNNNENKRNYAVMKALGFSSSYIIRRTTIRIGILVTGAAIMGNILNLVLSKELFKLAMKGADIIMIPGGQVLIITLVIAGITMLGTFISMRSIKKISTVELMEE